MQFTSAKIFCLKAKVLLNGRSFPQKDANLKLKTANNVKT